MLTSPSSGLCAAKNIHDHAALSASMTKNSVSAGARPGVDAGRRRMRHSANAISA